MLPLCCASFLPGRGMPAAGRCGPVFAHVSSDWQKAPLRGSFPRRGTPAKCVVWDFSRFQKIAWRKATHNSRFQPIRAVSSLGDAALDCAPPGPMRPYAVLPNGACRGPTQLDAVRTERARPVRAISAGRDQAKSSFPFRTRANEASIGSAHGSTKGLAMTRGFPLPCCREKESGPGALERRPARFLRKEEGFCPLQKTEPFSLPKQKASVNAVPSIPCSPRNHNIYFRPPTTAASVARSCPLRVLP